jgi:hypothetical protein
MSESVRKVRIRTGRSVRNVREIYRSRTFGRPRPLRPDVPREVPLMIGAGLPDWAQRARQHRPRETQAIQERSRSCDIFGAAWRSHVEMNCALGG